MAAQTAPGLSVFALVSPALALAALGPPLTLYLPEYFANHIGLPLGSVGAAFMWVRLIDIGFDPFLGAVMDCTRTRFGQFRLWLMAGVPLMVVSCSMLYLAVPGATMAYLVVGLALIYAAQSICHLAQNAWAARLSKSYNERSRIYAWNQAAGVAGMVVLLMLPPLVGQFTLCRVYDQLALDVPEKCCGVCLPSPTWTGSASCSLASIISRSAIAG